MSVAERIVQPQQSEDSELAAVALEIRRQTVKRGFNAGIAALLAIAIAGAIWLVMFMLAVDGAVPALLARGWVAATVSVLLGAFPVYGVFRDLQRRAETRRSAQRLTEARDHRHIGALVDLLASEDLVTRRQAENALIRRLPELRATDASLLTTNQHGRLLRILSLHVENPLWKDVREVFKPANGRAVELRVAILKALEQVGDGRAYMVVRGLAESKGRSPAERRIQAAAAECLPFLERRVQQEWQGKTLLRAAESSSAEDLLRPAIGAGDPELLLRESEQGAD